MADSRDDHVAQLIDRLFGVANQETAVTTGLFAQKLRDFSIVDGTSTPASTLSKKKKKPIDAANICSYTEYMLLKLNKHSAV